MIASSQHRTNGEKLLSELEADNIHVDAKVLKKAKSKDKKALEEIGNAYFRNNRMEKAAEWYEMVNTGSSLKRLADMYEYGQGMKMDKERAWDLYFDAARKDDTDACEVLSKRFRKPPLSNTQLEKEWSFRGSIKAGLSSRFIGSGFHDSLQVKTVDTLIKESIRARKRQKENENMNDNIQDLNLRNKRMENRIQQLESELALFKRQKALPDVDNHMVSQKEDERKNINYLMNENKAIKDENRDIRNEVQTIKQLLTELNMSSPSNHADLLNHQDYHLQNSRNGDNNDLNYDDNDVEPRDNKENQPICEENNNNDLGYDGT